MSPRVMNPKRRRVRRPVKKSADELNSDKSTTKEAAANASSVPKADRAPAKVAWMLSGTSAVLLWASFTPLDWGPLAWVALVPLILLVRATEPTREMYTTLTLTGFAFTLATLQWMRLGHVAMYAAWFALAAYLAIYFPVFVGITRVAVHRLSVPLVVAVPAVWVGLEYVRAHLMTGFSWYYLGHTQYRWIELIQVSDLVGAYGVSFIVATMAACLAAVLPASLLVRLRLLSPVDDATNSGGDIVKRPVVALLTGLILFAAVLGYGYFRRSEANFQQGPRIALIQGDFTSEVKHDPNAFRRMFDRHYQLTGLAVRHQPDLIVWPESMYRAPLLVASPEISDEELQRALPGATLL